MTTTSIHPGHDIMTTINTETTFDFGAGPVPAHRHINPNGDLGGWVHDTAVVDGGAYVSGEARVYGEACVSGEAYVYGNACVSGGAYVSGEARVYGEAYVYGEARVYGNARVYGEACVSGEACVYGEARVSITPAHLSGLTYTITITDAHIQLGCQVLDFHTFATLTRAQAYDLDGEKATAFYDAYYDILSALVSKKGT